MIFNSQIILVKNFDVSRMSNFAFRCFDFFAAKHSIYFLISSVEPKESYNGNNSTYIYSFSCVSWWTIYLKVLNTPRNLATALRSLDFHRSPDEVSAESLVSRASVNSALDIDKYDMNWSKTTSLVRPRALITFYVCKKKSFKSRKTKAQPWT